MNITTGMVAVITGAGSGFGREFARQCAARGMHLVLADVQADGLAETAALLGDSEVLTQTCDVSDPAAVEALADAAYARFGQVNLVFNNAGIAVSGPSWTATLDEWRWAIDVNVMGVVHGIRSFTQRMIDGGEPGRIINTASAAGVLSVPGSAVYCATKHAVVTISECLHHELTMLNAPVGVTLLCPAFVRTGIGDTDRLRPAGSEKNPHPMTRSSEAMTRQAIEKSRVSAEDVAAQTLRAVENDAFYVFTHPKIKASFAQRFEHLLDERDPHNSLAETS